MYIENPNLVKIRQKHHSIYMNNYVCFIVASNINLPQKCSPGMKWYQDLLIAKEA
jgi:hypothetical protein